MKPVRLTAPVNKDHSLGLQDQTFVHCLCPGVPQYSKYSEL